MLRRTPRWPMRYREWTRLQNGNPNGIGVRVRRLKMDARHGLAAWLALDTEISLLVLPLSAWLAEYRLPHLASHPEATIRRSCRPHTSDQNPSKPNTQRWSHGRTVCHRMQNGRKIRSGVRMLGNLILLHIAHGVRLHVRPN